MAVARVNGPWGFGRFQTVFYESCDRVSDAIQSLPVATTAGNDRPRDKIDGMPVEFFHVLQIRESSDFGPEGEAYLMILLKNPLFMKIWEIKND